MHPPPITMSTYRVSLPGDDGGVKGSHRLVSLTVEFFVFLAASQKIIILILIISVILWRLWAAIISRSTETPACKSQSIECKFYSGR